MTAGRVILDTRAKLSPRQERIWFSFIGQFAGADERIANSAARNGDGWRYESRGFPRLDPAKMDGVIMLWCEICSHDFDVACTVDHGAAASYGGAECGLEMDGAALEAVAEKASAFRHNRWVDRMVADGWRFGMAKDDKEKTDPLLREWHNLLERQRTKLEMEPAEALAFIGEHPSLFAGRL